MAGIKERRKKIQEHLEELQDAITLGIERRPATIGFHAVACATEMLEFYLHLKGVISTGKTIKHNWFKRPKDGQKSLPLIERKLPAVFPEKEKVYNLIYSLEENRNLLVYGKSSRTQTELVVSEFNKLRVILEGKINEEGESLE
ncbi:MAG: hypothetical protein ISS93_03770 [Candidatus Aenigmarchaeota archaeon]|nr:hypothetical protein [Candidatus Aenigmarchaeota archaeon]